jgi:hypothetical protein
MERWLPNRDFVRSVRFLAEHDEMIIRAAKAAGISYAELIRRAALTYAKRLIHRKQRETEKEKVVNQ